MPRLSRKESQEQTRQRLKDAAYHEFANKGIQGASIDRIAESAGYSRGAFYANYLNKKELLLDLLQENTASENLAIGDILDAAPDISDFILAIEKRFDIYVARKEQWMLSIHLMLEAQSDPDFKDIYIQYSQNIAKEIHPFAQKIINKAGLENKITADMFSIMWRSISLGLIFESHRGGLREGETAGKMMGDILRKILC